MATDFTLPELGENIVGGDVVRLLVSPGDTITKDQPVLELETDKATIEVPSNVSGTVKEVKIKQEDGTIFESKIVVKREYPLDEIKDDTGDSKVDVQVETSRSKRAKRRKI